MNQQFRGGKLIIFAGREQFKVHLVNQLTTILAELGIDSTETKVRDFKKTMSN